MLLAYPIASAAASLPGRALPDYPITSAAYLPWRLPRCTQAWATQCCSVASAPHVRTSHLARPSPRLHADLVARVHHDGDWEIG